MLLLSCSSAFRIRYYTIKEQVVCIEGNLFFYGIICWRSLSGIYLPN